MRPTYRVAPDGRLATYTRQRPLAQTVAASCAGALTLNPYPRPAATPRAAWEQHAAWQEREAARHRQALETAEQATTWAREQAERCG